MYNILFTFFDGHNLSIEVQDHHLDKFVDTIGEKKVFYIEDKSVGVWIDAEQVRYFFIKKITNPVQGEISCQKNQNLEAVPVLES